MKGRNGNREDCVDRAQGERCVPYLGPQKPGREGDFSGKRYALGSFSVNTDASGVGWIPSHYSFLFPSEDRADSILVLLIYLPQRRGVT